MQIVGTSLSVSGGPAKGGGDTKGGKWGAQGRRELRNQQSPFYLCWEGTELKFPHILKGGTEKLSVVPRLHTSCLILHTQLRRCGTACWLLPAMSLTVFPRRTQVEWQQEGERATCLPLAFSTKIYAPDHQSAVASSACPSWLPSPLSRCITDAGTRAPRCCAGWRNGEEGKGLHAPSGSELSAGAQVPNSPGIPLVFEEAQGSCRCTCACSRGLSERG